MLLIIIFDAFVQEWIQNYQEQHIHDQQWYHPNHNDHHHFDNSRISIFIFAFAARAKLLLFTVQFFRNARKNDAITVTRITRKQWEQQTEKKCVVSVYKNYLGGEEGLKKKLKKERTNHFVGGTFSIISIRSFSMVSFVTDVILGHMHLHRLSSYDCAWNILVHLNYFTRITSPNMLSPYSTKKFNKTLHVKYEIYITYRRCWYQMGTQNNCHTRNK